MVPLPDGAGIAQTSKSVEPLRCCWQRYGVPPVSPPLRTIELTLPEALLRAAEIRMAGLVPETANEVYASLAAPVWSILSTSDTYVTGPLLGAIVVAEALDDCAE